MTTPRSRARLPALGAKVRVVMDRPLGSKHPRFDFVYPINYGYIEEFIGGDGENLDAYVIGVSGPLKSFEGKVVAWILRKDDVEDKVVVAPADCFPTCDDVRAAVLFQERYFSFDIVL